MSDRTLGHCLESAIAGGFGYRQWIEHDSDLDPLRDHPRFRELLGRLPGA